MTPCHVWYQGSHTLLISQAQDILFLPKLLFLMMFVPKPVSCFVSICSLLSIQLVPH